MNRAVTSLTNPTVKAVRALHLRKEREETGLFVAEGLKIVTDAVERGRVVCVPGRVNRAIKTLMDVLPDRTALGLVARRARHFRVQD